MILANQQGVRVNEWPVVLSKWSKFSLGLLLLCSVDALAAPKRPVSTTPVVNNALKACLSTHQLWSATLNQSEYLLLQQTLKQISRHGTTLTLQIADPPIRLVDRCDDDVVVRYRVIDIRHHIDTWVIEQATPQRVRYLLMSFDGKQQLVVDSLPIFSEDSAYFAVFKASVLTDAVSTQLSIYRHTPALWQRELEQWRIQPCPSCELSLTRAPQWVGMRLEIPRPQTALPIRWIESTQWDDITQQWKLSEF